MRRPSSHTALLAGRRRRGPSRARWAACAAACFGAGLLLSLARGGGSVSSVTPPQHATLEVVEREAEPTAAAAAVGAAAASAVATTSTTQPSNKLRAHLVVYSHVDPGWLRTVDGYWEAGYKAGQNGVKNLIDGAVSALAAAPPSSNRSYTWGEMIYLERWWRQADDTAKAALKTAVADGRFAFAGGGWVSPDEATAHAVDMVDALAIGHDWLWRTFKVGPPTAAWQIDTFGHSAAHTALVNAAGADAIFFSRIDTEDRLHREAAKQLEFVWDSAPGAARGADVWCYAFYGGIYDIPPSIEALQYAVPSDPAAADAEWATRLANVTDYIKTVAQRSRGDGPVMISIARDFGWDDIGLLYDNLDELIKRAAAAGIDISYSTAPRHAAVRATDPRATWPVQQGDLFPYSDCKGCYWSGYFSTRPGTKRLVREASGVLAAARQADVWGRGAAVAAAAGPAEPVETLARAVALMQHHDAITGTDMAAVNADYRRIVTAAVAGGRRVIGAALDEKVFGGGDGAAAKLGGRKVGAGAASAATTTTANDDVPVPTFTFCEAQNASVCAPAVTLSDRLAPFTVAATSALPRARTAAIEVPLGTKAATVGWTAVAADDGARVRAQIVPTRADTRALHAHLVAVRAAGADDVAAATAVFEGRVPGMGYRVWTLVPDEEGGKSGGGAAASAPPPPTTTACSSFPSNCTDNGDAVVVTNGIVTLTFSRAAGGLTTVASTHPSAPTHPVAVAPSLRRYTHRLDTSIAAWFLRRSGHYAFHPAGDAEPLATGAATLDVVAGPALTTVTRRYGGYASLTVRLRAGAIAPELEWTVGPLPSPQDVVLRLDTDLPSEPGTLFTDANGREYIKRAKASRSTFVPAPIDPPYANPIGRDYYPTTVGAYVQGSDAQVSLLSDRPQGAASLAAGALEMMLHREAEACDELGNPEILAERIGGSPVVVRGVSLLAVTSIAGGPGVRRRLAAEAYHPVHVAFSGRVLMDGVKVGSAAASLLSTDLPPAVDLHKFGAASGGGGIDVRVAHVFDENEDAAASVPVSIDLKAAFVATVPFKSAHETAITGVPLSALRGGKGAAVPAVHPRRGERIFAGPKFFDYDNLSAPGVDVPGVSVSAPPLVPRPKKVASGGVDKAGRFKLAPLEVKSVRLAFGGGSGGDAKSV